MSQPERVVVYVCPEDCGMSPLIDPQASPPFFCHNTPAHDMGAVVEMRRVEYVPASRLEQVEKELEQARQGIYDMAVSRKNDYVNRAVRFLIEKREIRRLRDALERIVNHPGTNEPTPLIEIAREALASYRAAGEQ